MAYSVAQTKGTWSRSVGLALALVVPLLYSFLIGPLLIKPITAPVAYAIIGFAVYWALTLCLLIITRTNQRPLRESFNIKRLTWKMVLIAVGLGILLAVLVPLLTLLVSQIVPASETGGVMDVTTSFPAWVILASVLTAGVTEEVIFRVYAIERLLELTGSRWAAALISLVAFVLVHVAGWNLGHILGVVVPLGTILTALYLWQRNFIFMVIIHILVDLPLFFLALGT